MFSCSKMAWYRSPPLAKYENQGLLQLKKIILKPSSEDSPLRWTYTEVLAPLMSELIYF